VVVQRLNDGAMCPRSLWDVIFNQGSQDLVRLERRDDGDDALIEQVESLQGAFSESGVAPTVGRTRGSRRTLIESVDRVSIRPCSCSVDSKVARVRGINGLVS
jgi:hypothetical protein